MPTLPTQCHRPCLWITRNIDMDSSLLLQAAKTLIRLLSYDKCISNLYFSREESIASLEL